MSHMTLVRSFSLVRIQVTTILSWTLPLQRRIGFTKIKDDASGALYMEHYQGIAPDSMHMDLLVWAVHSRVPSALVHASVIKIKCLLARYHIKDCMDHSEISITAQYTITTILLKGENLSHRIFRPFFQNRALWKCLEPCSTPPGSTLIPPSPLGG